MASEHTQILNDLKNKKYKPVYFLSGEEPYFIDQISDDIEANVLDESEKAFDLTVLYGKDIVWQQIITEAKCFPVIGKYKVVIIKEAQNVKDIEEIEKYVIQPSPQTILVICYKYKTLDKRKKVVKVIEGAGVYLETKKLYDDKVPGWINDYMKGKNFSVSARAAVLLTEFLGNDLGKIANELDKLMVNVPEKTEITPAHIEKYIGISKDYNNFELQKALGFRDVLKANQIINYFAANPKNNPMVVTMITLYSYFSTILNFHYLPDKSERSAAAALRVNPYFVKDYIAAARNYDIRKTVQVIGLLREYDMKSKGVDSGNAEDGELLKELVFKILH
jgi:DNA polymerase III subunit delta